jgi:hypothetical protein
MIHSLSSVKVQSRKIPRVNLLSTTQFQSGWIRKLIRDENRLLED